LVSLKFAQGKRRGKLSYVAKALTEYLKYKSETYQIEMPDGTVTEKAFLIACGNASQYGNNAYIAPHASMQDGKIDVTVLMPFTPFDTAGSFVIYQTYRSRFQYQELHDRIAYD
jgi:diacylglycerol kinase (ATP)